MRGKRYKLDTQKGTRGEANVRLSQDICGFNFKVLKQQLGKGKMYKLGTGGKELKGAHS